MCMKYTTRVALTRTEKLFFFFFGKACQREVIGVQLAISHGFL